MFDEIQTTLPDVTIEKIDNGYIVHIVGKSKVHAKTLNGVTRILEVVFKDKLIYDKEYVNRNQ